MVECAKINSLNYKLIIKFLYMEIFEKSSNEKGFFDTIRSKHAFFLGLSAGVGVMVLVGFVVVTTMFFSGYMPTAGGANKAGQVVDTTGDTVPGDTAQPTEIVINPVTKDDWIRGDKKAPVTIVEYSDTECPFCKRHHETLKKLVEDYKGQVSWVYRNFPIPSLHAKAQKEAEALECAGDLGGNDAFWKYTDMVYEKTPSNDGLDPADLPKFAESIGLNKAKFEECLNSGKMAEKVKQTSEDAVSAGAQGTPHNVIIFGDQKIPVAGAYPIEEFKKIIDPLLN